VTGWCGYAMGQGCQIFFIAYGQNLDKKWPKWLFLKKLWPKSQNVLSLTIVIPIFTGVSKYSEGSIFFAQKMWFCQRSKFLP